MDTLNLMRTFSWIIICRTDLGLCSCSPLAMHKIVAVVLFDGQPRLLVLATEECATTLLFFGESLPGKQFPS